MDLLQFAQLIERRSQQLETNSLKNKKELTRVILKELATNTPIDVGTAISNWKVNLGYNSADFSNLAFSPGRRGSTLLGNISGTISAGEAVIANMRLGQLVVIGNTVDYIVGLNDGTSKQEPAGFVERAVQTGEALVPRLKPIENV
jgi:hypothetical protein